MAAQIKEVAGNADRFQAQHCLPDGRQGRFQRRSGRDIGFRGGRKGGCWQLLAVNLPVGRQRPCGQQHPSRR